MGGNVKFEDALAARLALIEPSRASILKCIQERPFKLTPGVAELIKALHDKGVDVWFVSGGFRIMIEPIATVLSVPTSNILANTILFKDDEEGTYAGFDDKEPTSADMGKPRAVTLVKSKTAATTVVMVGDGATDLQAVAPGAADKFIGFGGVADREVVREKADWFVYNFDEVTQIVKGLD
jgi:phosphoserine phosphatase